MRLIGLDIGTTSCKAHVFEEDGGLAGSSCREYSIDVPRPGWAEQDAELVWTLAQESIREAVARAGSGPRIGAIGLSVQGEAVIPVAEDGRALRPAILGMDMRTAAQNEWLESEFGNEVLYKATGMPILTVNSLPKLLWLRQEEPATWQTAERFHLYEDFLIRKMTGTPLISHCLASRTQCYDLSAGGWSSMVLQKIGLSEDRLSRIADSGTSAGPMLPSLAAPLGLPPDRPPLVATGGHDSACAALGAGLVRPGLAMDSTGTAEVVEVALAAPVLDDGLCRAKVSVYRHVVPGLFLAMTLNHSGGIALRWFRDTFCTEDIRQAGAKGCDAYDLILRGAGPQPSPVLFMPHMSGSGTPVYDSLSKGCLAGLTLATTRTDIARAILEGLCCELRIHLDVLQEGGIQVEQLLAVGGAARSALWLQMKADISGRLVAAPAITEAAGLGAAVLAGVAAGCYTDARQAMRTINPALRVYAPHSERARAWNERYQLYCQMYPSVRDINKRL